MIKAVIFDWGGVLTKGPYSDSAFKTMEKRFDSVTDKIFPIFDKLVVQMDAGDLSFPGFVKELNERFGLGTNKEEILGIFRESLDSNDRVIEIINNLKGKYLILALANQNPPSDYAMREGAPEIVKLFKRVYLSYKYKLRKPDPRFFRLPLKDFDLKAEECVFIDDKEKNVKAAREIGMKGIFFRNAEQLKNDLNNFGIKPV